MQKDNLHIVIGLKATAIAAASAVALGLGNPVAAQTISASLWIAFEVVNERTVKRLKDSMEELQKLYKAVDERTDKKE